MKSRAILLYPAQDPSHPSVQRIHAAYAPAPLRLSRSLGCQITCQGITVVAFKLLLFYLMAKSADPGNSDAKEKPKALSLSEEVRRYSVWVQRYLWIQTSTGGLEAYLLRISEDLPTYRMSLLQILGASNTCFFSYFQVHPPVPFILGFLSSRCSLTALV